MKKDWRTGLLGEYSDIILGGTPKTKEPSYWDGNIPWATIVDFYSVNKKLYKTEKTITEKGLNESKLLDVGDIIISARGTVGKTIVCGTPMAFNQSCYALKSRTQKLFQGFLYYLINHQVIELKKKATGGVFDTIVIDTLKRLRIELPPPDTQQKIAAILSAYDDLIEYNLRRIKILEEMAQTLYREWFINFRFPGHQKVKMVDSPLGKIPEGWEVKRLGEVVELAYGKGLKEQDRIPGGVPVFGSSGVVGYHNQSLVNGPGIIVGRKGNVGSVHWTDDPFFPIDTVFYVITELPLHYVFFNLQTQNFISGDAAVPGLNRNQAYSLPVILPKPDVLGFFSQSVEPIFHLLDLLRKKNGLLRQTRDLLLPKLISGEVDVSELDVKIPETERN